MIARATGYVRGANAGQRLTAHIKYIQHRVGEEEPRTLFGDDGDDLTRQEARADIMDHTSAAVSYHKIVLSPSSEEREGITDWQEWTREVMGDLAEAKGLELHWVAAKHENTDDPHIHVVLAGAGEDADGHQHPMRMDREDYQQLRESGAEHSHVEQTRMIAEADRAFGETWETERSPDAPEHAARQDDHGDRWER